METPEVLEADGADAGTAGSGDGDCAVVRPLPCGQPLNTWISETLARVPQFANRSGVAPHERRARTAHAPNEYRARTGKRRRRGSGGCVPRMRAPEQAGMWTGPAEADTLLQRGTERAG